jgi:integrase/recombinase XerD
VRKRQRGRPKGLVGKAAILGSAQIKEVLRVARREGRYTDRAEIALALSIEVGLRAIELAALKWTDIYNSDGTVRQTIIVRRAYLKGAQSSVELVDSPKLRNLLADYREKQMASFNWQIPLFRSQRGGHMTAASMARYLTELYRRAGLADASSLSGRRTHRRGIA